MPIEPPIQHDKPVRVVAGRLMLDPGSLPDEGWIVIDGGRIVEVRIGPLPNALMSDAIGGPDRLICPAFTDAHFHFPQIDSIGCDGLELLEWLDRVIFPAEGWWGRAGGATLTRTAARRLCRAGTAGVAGYFSSHGLASHESFALLMNATRLRFIVGRAAMDRNAPDDLVREDRERSKLTPPPSPRLACPEGNPRHRTSFTPRFAISCTDELLAEIGWHVKDEPQTYIQTHLAESLSECRAIAQLFPSDPHYTGVYDRFGLLHDRTILAHCIHLNENEWKLIAERGAIVAHCPAANIFLLSGLFDLDAARRFGVRLALGSDVAAGSDVDMPRVARGMIETAKVRRLTARNPMDVSIPSPIEAWRMITGGNASLLGWHDAGRIEAGCMADLLVLRPPATWIDEHLIGRLIYNWSSRLIEARVFDGRFVDPDRVASPC